MVHEQIKSNEGVVDSREYDEHEKHVTNRYLSIRLFVCFFVFFFFFNDTATTEIYTLSLHDALPI